MPLQELLYKERYETVLNEAMRYSMEFDMPDEEINAFISYIGKANKCDGQFRYRLQCNGRWRHCCCRG